MSSATQFDYDKAFCRNRGLVTAEEQTKLRRARVLLLGAGGVGGGHAITLARLGVGHFRIVDPDLFDVVNFNRQLGATMSHLGQPKAGTVAGLVRDINPEAEIEAFDEPMTEANVDALLAGVQLVVDGLDFFALDVRLAMAAAARRAGIPLVTSGPIGMSATLHVFTADSMSLADYFDIRPGMSYLDRMVAFLVGLTPAMTQRPYMDLRESDPLRGSGPSLGAACMLCAGLVGIEALRILLGRSGLRPAPHYLQFDAYRQQLRRGYLLWGNRNPWQRLKRVIARRMLLRLHPELEPYAHPGALPPS